MPLINRPLSWPDELDGQKVGGLRLKPSAVQGYYHCSEQLIVLLDGGSITIDKTVENLEWLELYCLGNYTHRGHGQCEGPN